MNRARLAFVLCVVSSPVLASPLTDRFQGGHYEGWLLAQAAPSNDVAGRELTIAAMQNELAELQDQASSVGFVFPVLGIGLGVGMIALGASSGADALGIAGLVVGALSSVWLLYRIVRRISLGHDIGKLEDQLDQLKAQRLPQRAGPPPLGPGAVHLAQLSFAF
ncbi:MAG: hypothetical protein ACYC8T_02680 [Myxococcaceae bacterium]